MEVALRRPPAAGDADEACRRDLPDVDVGLVERRHELGRVAARPEGYERRALARRWADDLEPLREKHPAALGDGSSVLEGPRGTRVERGEETGERRRGPPARVETRSAGL